MKHTVFMFGVFLICQSLCSCATDNAIGGRNALPPNQRVIESSSHVMENLPATKYAIDQLGGAANFYGKETGYANEKCKDYRLYETVLKIAPKSQEELKHLLGTGSPAGKLYAAILLQKLAPTEGEQALHTLLNDQSKVVFGFHGCMDRSGTVSEVANKLLENPKIRSTYFE